MHVNLRRETNAWLGNGNLRVDVYDRFRDTYLRIQVHYRFWYVDLRIDIGLWHVDLRVEVEDRFHHQVIVYDWLEFRQVNLGTIDLDIRYTFLTLT